MKILFHIGWPKTGTSALQNWLAKNDSLLEEKRILYPKTGRDPIGAHNLLVAPIINDPLYPVSFSEESIWGELVREIAEKSSAQTIETLILSSENFVQVADFEALFGYLKPFKGPISLVAVVREQCAIIRSLYAQHTCDPHLHTTLSLMETFECNKHRFLYHEILERFKKANQWDEFRVINYDSDPLSKWIADTGLSFVPGRPATFNVSPTPEIIEIIRRTNEYPMTLSERKRLNQITLASKPDFKLHRPLMTRANAEAIRSYYFSSNAALARDYGIVFADDSLVARPK